MTSEHHEIEALRTKLMFDPGAVFYVPILMAMNLVRTKAVPTACTNGTTLKYNPDFLVSLEPAARLGLMVYEALHVAHDHICRRANRDMKLWNVATDLAINSYIRKAGYKLPDGALYPEAFGEPEGRSAEEYYTSLAQKRQEQSDDEYSDGQTPSDNDDDESDDDGECAGDNESDTDDNTDDGDGTDGGDGDGDESDSDDGDSTDGEADDGDGTGSGAGDGDGDGDSASDGAAQTPEEIADNLNRILNDDPGQCGGIDDAPEEDKPRIHQVVREAMEIAKGNMPGELQDAIDAAQADEVDYRAMLEYYVSEAARNDYRWIPPDRRFIGEDIYLPAAQSDALGDIVVALDTSGSMWGPPLAKARGALAEILNAYDCSATLLYHDADIDDPIDKWTSGDGEIPERRYSSGGTDHRPVFDWINTHAPDAKLVVLLTDMYTDFPKPKDEPTCPVLWIAVGSCYSEEQLRQRIPFGDVVKIECDE